MPTCGARRRRKRVVNKKEKRRIQRGRDKNCAGMERGQDRKRMSDEKMTREAEAERQRTGMVHAQYNEAREKNRQENSMTGEEVK